MKSLYLLPLAVAILCSNAGAQDARPWFGSEPEAVSLPIKELRTSIRVGILKTSAPLALSSSARLLYVPLSGGRSVGVPASTNLIIKSSKQGLLADGKLLRGNLLVSAANPQATITLNGRAYRGALIIQPLPDGSMQVIEQLGLEEYIYGVLPREVGCEWPAESLKAQAVVSRTYVLANLGQNQSRGYDVANDVSAQVYGGRQSEKPGCNAAVDATHGEILTDDVGKPIQSYFHSSCGGRTEMPYYVWKTSQEGSPYLKSVRDTYCHDEPYAHWSVTMALDVLRRKLRAAGYNVGAITKVSTGEKGPSGRAATMIVQSSTGKTTIGGNAFRLAVGPSTLRSMKFTRLRTSGRELLVEGEGWGHGVGLCQWGARGRALAGHSYRSILEAYYPGVKFREIVPAGISSENEKAPGTASAEAIFGDSR